MLLSTFVKLSDMTMAFYAEGAPPHHLLELIFAYIRCERAELGAAYNRCKRCASIITRWAEEVGKTARMDKPCSLV